MATEENFLLGIQQEVAYDRRQEAETAVDQELALLVTPVLLNAAAPPTTTLATQYAVGDARRKALEEELKTHKEGMAIIEAQLLERFAQEGVKSIRTNKGLVYLHKQTWASCSDPAELAKTAWAWLVKGSVNSQTLSAQVRELPVDEETDESQIPEAIKPFITVTGKFSVRVRGG